MITKGGIQTPFDESVAPVQTGAPSGGGVTGGFDLGDGSEKETANSLSGLPTQVTTFALEGGVPDQVAWPEVDSPGTLHPGK